MYPWLGHPPIPASVELRVKTVLPGSKILLFLSPNHSPTALAKYRPVLVSHLFVFYMGYPYITWAGLKLLWLKWSSDLKFPK